MTFWQSIIIGWSLSIDWPLITYWLTIQLQLLDIRNGHPIAVFDQWNTFKVTKFKDFEVVTSRGNLLIWDERSKYAYKEQY